jgi:multiple sugar transport system permease protein
VGSASRRRLRADLLPYLLFFPAFLAIGAILFYPVIQALLISLRSYYLPSVAVTGTPFCGLANYRAISAAPEFWSALLFNGIYTVGSVAGLYLVSLAVALLLNDEFRGRGLFRGLAIVPWAVPYVVAALTWIWIFDIQFGVLNSVLLRMGVVEKAIPWLLSPHWAKFSVILSTIWKQFPFAAIMLLAGLQGIPRVMYEAASVDGAGPLGRFRYVTMPGLHNVSLLVILLSGIQVFKLFTVIYLLTAGGPGRATETLVVQTYLEAFSTFDMGRASAIGVVTLVLTLLFSFVLIRFGYREEVKA